ncbi:Septum site-determining protein divIVA Cell division initiation protein divIVA [Proteiniborus sp. DW1]|uniref:DivIVA domain-containing protein n=1 Tax=Proteiniborus sp. DW1 TaxID=1889883 RepID=UPI00092E1C39|nr:DivIVA domain-containing protein [Proteiniborus sp. DW1]SCG83525.1 Septum site-determining protein divIVA Cell division initiation protein divIVA [Proteiniborus sp. DW1]
MLTPLDIQNKEFKRGVRGYKETDVDAFLDEIMIDYEKIYKENIELKDKISMLNDQIKHYNKIEETLQNTLVVAQSTAEEVKISAKKSAELIIKEAEDNSKKIIEEAKNEALKVREEYETLRKDMLVFKTRFKTLLQSQLESLDDYYKDLGIDNSEE